MAFVASLKLEAPVASNEKYSPRSGIPICGECRLNY